jgi:phage-related protein
MLAPIFMAAGPVVMGFSGIMGLLNGITLTSTFSFMGLNVAMLPVTAIIIGIGLAIAAGILIWKNWDTIINALKKSLDVLKATFKIVFDFIKEIVSKVFTTITAIYNSKLGWILPAGPLIKAILFLSKNWEEVWDGIKATFDTVTGALIGTFRTVKGTILGIWDGLVSGIKGGISSVIGAINLFIRGINAIKIRVPGVDIPLVGRVGGFSIGMPQIPEIPRMAKGGIVNRPTLAMLGESGPEAVVPLGKGGAGMTVNLVINGDINGMDDFEQKVTSVIRDAVLGGGFSGVLARA